MSSVRGWLLIRNCVFEDNKTSSTIPTNTPIYFGGSTTTRFITTITNSIFRDHMETGNLIWINSESVAEFYNCTFTNNRKIVNMQRATATLKFVNSFFSGNGTNYFYILSGNTYF